MKSLRYLNSILTILAVLLTLNLWTLWTSGALQGGPEVATPAQAQGIPNAGAQRIEMINELKQQTGKLDQLITLLKSGQARVRVEAGAGNNN